MAERATEQEAHVPAGVATAARQQAKELMAAAIRATFGPEVLSDIGAFGGLFDASNLKNMARPVLVAATGGVGAKTKVAARLGRWDTIGHDIVNHCLNDILAQGARPLFFLDYVASSQLDPEQIATIVGGVALACSEAGCALLGGETAETPGIYQPGEVELVGTVIGVVDRDKVIDGRRIQPGDAIVGLPANGLHTSGYALAYRSLNSLNWNEPRPELENTSLGEALLAPHRSYLGPLRQLQAAGVDIRGLAHITGGGLVNNPPRIFPPGIRAVIQRGSWPEPPIFSLIRDLGQVADTDMFDIFNMGLGMLAILPSAHVSLAQTLLGNEGYVVGQMAAGQRGLKIRH